MQANLSILCAAMVEPEALVPNFEKGKAVVLSNECNTLLQTLPSQKGWIPYLDFYLYQGFWHRPEILNRILSVQKNFRPNHSDILLATSPKAGTTWLKALVFALVNRGADLNLLLQKNPHDLIPFLELKKDTNPDLSSFAVDAPRQLFSTHIPFSSLPSSAKCKIVYLCRNPNDAVISMWHFMNKVTKLSLSLEEVVDKFCDGVSSYGPFWDHVLEYWKASEEMPHNVLFLKYEEIKEQPHKELRKLADFLGCPFSSEEESSGKVEEISKMCSFEKLSGLQVNTIGKTLSGTPSNVFFRQGKVGDSANYLTQEMIQKLDRVTKEKLCGSTLKLI